MAKLAGTAAHRRHRHGRRWRQRWPRPNDRPSCRASRSLRTPVETDKEDDDNEKQNEHDDNIPRSEHAGSTQNSQPQSIAHISKMQGCRTKTATHQERGGTHPPEVANWASQHAKDPASPMRVQDILDKISIGPDLMGAQWVRVMDLIREYPDIFALSLSEVFPVDFMQHKLKIDPDTVLPKKAYQRPMMEPQREFFSDIINDMETAGIIQVIPADTIKCLNLMHLAPKDGGKNLGMTRAALLHRCNQQFQANRLPDFWEQIEDREVADDSSRGPEAKEEGPKTPPKKWQVCQAFHAVNAVTQVPAFLSRDLKTKQQAVAGKRWVSVIDLTAGYYTIKMDEEAVPYMAFHVEGQGFYAYL